MVYHVYTYSMFGSLYTPRARDREDSTFAIYVYSGTGIHRYIVIDGLRGMSYNALIRFYIAYILFSFQFKIIRIIVITEFKDLMRFSLFLR